jgi:hypothetical protein
VENTDKIRAVAIDNGGGGVLPSDDTMKTLSAFVAPYLST